MPAFENGMACGADGLEFDVRLSRDGVAVVIHDPTVERTTDGTGEVAALTAAELAALDAGSRFTCDGAFPFRGRGIGVPTLNDVLQGFPGVSLLVEMKLASDELAAAVVKEIHAVDGLDRISVGSFHQGAIEAVRRLEPKLRTGADTDEIKNEMTRGFFGQPTTATRFHSFQVPELFTGIRIVTEDFVTRAHQAGVTVIVWTVDRAEDIIRLLDWGVDGIISDRPDVAVPTAHAWYAARQACDRSAR